MKRTTPAVQRYKTSFRTRSTQVALGDRRFCVARDSAPVASTTLWCVEVCGDALTEGPWRVDGAPAGAAVASLTLNGRGALAAVSAYEARLFWADTGAVAAIAALPGSDRPAPAALAAVGDATLVVARPGALEALRFEERKPGSWALAPVAAAARTVDALCAAGAGWCVGAGARGACLCRFSGDAASVGGSAREYQPFGVDARRRVAARRRGCDVWTFRLDESRRRRGGDEAP